VRDAEADCRVDIPAFDDISEFLVPVQPVCLETALSPEEKFQLHVVERQGGKNLSEMDMPSVTAGGMMTCARTGRSRYLMLTDTIGLSLLIVELEADAIWVPMSLISVDVRLLSNGDMNLSPWNSPQTDPSGLMQISMTSSREASVSLSSEA